jgi:hypothetical protein
MGVATRTDIPGTVGAYDYPPASPVPMPRPRYDEPVPEPLGLYTEPAPTGPFTQTGPLALTDPFAPPDPGVPAGPRTGALAVGTTAGAFAVLDSSIRLRDADHAVVGSRREAAEHVLRALFPPRSPLPLVGVATIGSAGRDTMIRPLDEVDVFAVFSAVTGAWKRFQFDSGGLLSAVRDALGGEGVEVIGSRGKALRVVYDVAPDVHLIPAFDHPRAGYVMPDGVGGWLPTRPERHSSWMAEFGPVVASTVRLLKFWNRVYGSHMRSFHLEVLVGAAVGSRDLDTRQALHEVFTVGERGLSAFDPAGVGGDLSSYLGTDDLAILTDAFAFARAHSGQAVVAEAVGDHEEAISMWRVVFGPNLPAFG